MNCIESENKCKEQIKIIQEMNIQLDKYKIAIDEIIERNKEFKKREEERIRVEVEQKVK